MINGDFVYHDDGTMIDYCDYKNCLEPNTQISLRCEAHTGAKYPELEKARTKKRITKYALGLLV